MFLNDKNTKKYLYYWLITMFGLVSGIIVVGGLTRLTDSGLSITEWEFFKGFFPPVSKSAWIEYFEAYNKIPEFWDIKYNKLNIKSLPTPFRHLGFFPEQSVHWKWCRDLIQSSQIDRPRVLNLFGYSGIASLDAAIAGASVTHIDASKKAINLAFENRNRNNLESFPIRYLVEDAVSFVKKEINRGKKYDGIILDPPKYGRGPNGEIWKIEENLLDLMLLIKEILSENPLFLVITSYAIRSSHMSLYNLLKSSLNFDYGKYSSGELGIRESGKKGRVLSCANFARWEIK